jgi:hypothetical protein
MNDALQKWMNECELGKRLNNPIGKDGVEF